MHNQALGMDHKIALVETYWTPIFKRNTFPGQLVYYLYKLSETITVIPTMLAVQSSEVLNISSLE
jgi:hypothetical protein